MSRTPRPPVATLSGQTPSAAATQVRRSTWTHPASVLGAPRPPRPSSNPGRTNDLLWPHQALVLKAPRPRARCSRSRHARRMRDCGTNRHTVWPCVMSGPGPGVPTVTCYARKRSTTDRPRLRQDRTNVRSRRFAIRREHARQVGRVGQHGVGPRTARTHGGLPQSPANPVRGAHVGPGGLVQGGRLTAAQAAHRGRRD